MMPEFSSWGLGTEEVVILGVVVGAKIEVVDIVIAVAVCC